MWGASRIVGPRHDQICKGLSITRYSFRTQVTTSEITTKTELFTLAQRSHYEKKK